MANLIPLLSMSLEREIASIRALHAAMYLRVIAGDHEVNLSNWTSADTSRLFLCAFLVGTPFATTIKVKENLQAIDQKN